MSKFMAIIIFSLYSSFLMAEQVIKNNNESNEEFVKRFIPDGASISHGVIETNEWHFQASAIIAFYEQADNVYGLLFVPISTNKYDKIEIDAYGPEGRNAEIQSVFFAKAGVKEYKEMFVIVSWSNNAGTLYNTYAYERPQPNISLPKLVFLEKLSKTFGMECDYCPYSDHPDKPAKYKTAADVKAELKRRQK